MRASGIQICGFLASFLALAPVSAGADENAAAPRNRAQIDRCTTSHDATSRVWACSLLLNSTPPAPADAAAYHLSRGYAFLALKWEAAALHDFAEALAFEPKLPEVYQVRVQIFRDRRDYRRAADDLSHLIELSPSDPILHIERGSTLAFTGAFNDAIEDFTTAISMAESYEPIADFYLARSATFEMAGQYEAALRDVETALARNEDQARGLETKGRLLFLMNRWSEAQSVLTQAAAAEGAGPYAPIWLYLANQRISGGKMAAVPAATSGTSWPAPVLDVLTGRARVADNLPIMWFLGRDDAFDAKTRLCELSYFMGESLLGAGHADDARRYFKQAENTKLNELVLFHAAVHRLSALAETNAAFK